MKEKNDRCWDYGIGLGLVLMTAFVFARVMGYGFVNFDDPEYVYANPYVRAGLTWEGLRWAFTNIHFMHWFPLTYLSHMVAVALFGLNPWGHHLFNVLLHAGNCLLLFRVFKAMTGARWQSGLVAALFAVHPINVESVAWIAERSNVLSTCFWMLTIGGYVLYVRKPSRGRYLGMITLYALGLMAKPLPITLPFVLLLLDFWPLGRRGWELAREKIPLFLLSGLCVSVSIVSQMQVHALSPLGSLTLAVRMSNALMSYVQYIGKMFWPVYLSVFYPYHSASLIPWKVVMAGLALTIVSILAFRWRRSRPYFTVGWLWYVGTLIPMIGLAQLGSHAMADRYAYVPLIGLFLAVVWGASELVRRWRFSKAFVGASVASALMALMATSSHQATVWRDTISLFEHAIKVTSKNCMAHYQLALTLANQGRLSEAIFHHREALKILPNIAGIHSNLGVALARDGQEADAMAEYSEALRLDPQYPDAHYNLGVLLAKQGKTGEATQHYYQALQITPMDPDLHNNLGLLLGQQGKTTLALAHFQEALKISPGHVQARRNLQNATGEGNVSHDPR